MSRTDSVFYFTEAIIRIITLDYFVIKRIIRKFLKQAKTVSVFDLGCGTGVLCPLFPKNGYVGVDIDPALIDYAKKRHHGYKFLVGDVTKICLKKKFHTIVVVGVIHHLNDVEVRRMVGTIQNHLTKNGKVLIIEAIPPIFRWNILGTINRKMDRGAYIRKLDEYRKFVKNKFSIDEAYNQLGGVADYGVLFLSKR